MPEYVTVACDLHAFFCFSEQLTPNPRAQSGRSGAEQRMSDLEHLAHAATRFGHRTSRLWEGFAVHPDQTQLRWIRLGNGARTVQHHMLTLRKPGPDILP